MPRWTVRIARNAAVGAVCIAVLPVSVLIGAAVVVSSYGVFAASRGCSCCKQSSVIEHGGSFTSDIDVLEFSQYMQDAESALYEAHSEACSEDTTEAPALRADISY